MIEGTECAVIERPDHRCNDDLVCISGCRVGDVNKAEHRYRSTVSHFEAKCILLKNFANLQPFGHNHVREGFATTGLEDFG